MVTESRASSAPTLNCQADSRRAFQDQNTRSGHGLQPILSGTAETASADYAYLQPRFSRKSRVVSHWSLGVIASLVLVVVGGGDSCSYRA